MLRRLKDGDQPENVVLNHVNYWIQVHDVPCGFMTEWIAEQIGNSLGTFVQNDPNNFGGNWKSYMRIREAIDVNRPLKTRLKLRKIGGEWVWVVFKYERLYTFCYYCGKVGHSEKFCVKAIESDAPLNEYVYGPWLRVPARRFASSVGDRWLIKDVPIGVADMETGSRSGGESGATTPRMLPVMAGGAEDTDRNGMNMDEDGMTVTEAKRKRGMHDSVGGGTAHRNSIRLQHPENSPASPASQARHLP